MYVGNSATVTIRVIFKKKFNFSLLNINTRLNNRICIKTFILSFKSSQKWVAIKFLVGHDKLLKHNSVKMENNYHMFIIL